MSPLVSIFLRLSIFLLVGSALATGSVIQTTDARGNVTRSVHDARERLLQTIAPAVYDAESQQGNRPSTVTNTYDKVGNVVAVTNARGYSTLTSYDAANRAVQVSLPTYRDPLTQSDVTPTTVNEYDLAGNPVKVTDANGSVTINTYDPLNRVTSTKTNPTVPASTSSHADDQIVAFEWDKAGNKTKVTDGLAQVTSFQYDGKNRLTATIWDSDDSTRIRTDTTEYDALVATATVNQRPVRIEHAYNARLLLTGSTCTQLPGDNETRTYDNAGRLLTVKRTGAGDLRNVTYTYDASDRMTSETSAGSTHSYGYDPAGNRTLVQYSTGRKLATVYDSQNRVATITESVTGNTATRETGYQYDLAGNVLIRSQANGTREYSGYNAAGRRVSQSTVRGATPVSDFAYFHAPGGNLLRIDETYGSTSVPDRNVINTYDRQNRLLTEKAETLDSSHAVTKSVLTTYVYNKGDNRTSKNVTETQGATVISNKTETSVYGSAGNGTNSNQLHSLTKDGQTSTYAYDASGNRITRSVGGVLKETYGWDSKNRLVSLVQSSPSKTFSYGYDYRARRVIRDESSAGGENTAVSFSGGTSAFEKVGTTVKVEYVRGSDYGGGIGGIMYTVRSGVNSFNAYNSRGDVVAKTTDAGTVSWQATYESFGTRTTETGTNPDRQKANTKEEDPTGLLNEGFRYRDLVTGSFISRDPLGFVDGPNVYTYVRQNRWTAFDPNGLYGIGESNGAILDGLWNHVVTPAAHFTGEAVIGYGEVAIKGEKVPGSFNTRAGTFGRNTGRLAAAVVGVGEMVQGGGLFVTGATIDAVGVAAASFTGGGGLILEVPGTVVAGVGAVEMLHGAYSLTNGLKLGLESFQEASPSGSSSSPAGPTAKDTSDANAGKDSTGKPTKDQIAKEPGSYTNTHESGKTYDGKGSRKRSQDSAARVEQETGDKHTATDWTPAQTHREAFKQESRRLDSNGGAKSENNHNRIESPGKKMRDIDGED